MDRISCASSSARRRMLAGRPESLGHGKSGLSPSVKPHLMCPLPERWPGITNPFLVLPTPETRTDHTEQLPSSKPEFACSKPQPARCEPRNLLQTFSLVTAPLWNAPRFPASDVFNSPQKNKTTTWSSTYQSQQLE